MKNKFFTHRFLPILSVFLFTIFLFFTNVKATDENSNTKTVVIDENIYTLPNDCTDNFFICENVNNTVYLIFGNYTDWKFSENNGDVVVNNINNGSVQNFTVYVISKGSYNFNNYTNKFTTTWTSINPQKNVSYAGCKVLYSTSDLYTASGDVFFQVPLLKMGEIMGIAQTEIAPTILIVITVTAGLVILLIGLKKGFRILVNGLKI